MPSATPSGCVAVPVDPRVQQFLNLLPPANEADNGDGTGDLITADKSATREDHGTVRIDQNFSNTHSLFARYTFSRRLIIRSSRTRCNIISIWNGKSRRA
jgi:hypothetical protein